MPYQAIKDNMQSYLSFTEEELTIFCSHLKVKHISAKDFWIQQGDICQSIAFINKGCMRYFTVKDGEETTGQFFFENVWYTDFKSYLMQTPSNQYMQAIEPLELYLLSKQSQEELCAAMPKMNTLNRMIVEKSFISCNETALNL